MGCADSNSHYVMPSRQRLVRRTVGNPETPPPCEPRQTSITPKAKLANLDGATDAQLANLLKDLLNAGIQLALCILISGLGVQILLDLGHPAVGLGTESELDLDQGLEGRVEVRNAQVDKLGKLGAQLLVQLFVGGLRHILFFLGAGQLGDILVRLVDQALDFGAERIIVKELVASLLDAYEGSGSA